MKPHLIIKENCFNPKIGDRSQSYATISNTSLSELDNDLNELEKVEYNQSKNPYDRLILLDQNNNDNKDGMIEHKFD